MIATNQPGGGLAQTSASAILAQNLGIWPGTISPVPVLTGVSFSGVTEAGNEAIFKELDIANYAKGA